MASQAHDAYLESEILTSDPVELVQLLYRAALEAVRQARAWLEQGRIRERSESISRASAILNELALAVDHSAGGNLSRNLVELYAYLQGLLLDANARQQPAPLEEAERLLASLAEAWRSCGGGAGRRAPETYSETPAGYRSLSCTC
ncbi:MAG: flagellar export chaperone FliS [Acidobacteria bacterium]|nr:flagellar export chaperone FliS [Acidobacteriota bacterium]